MRVTKFMISLAGIQTFCAGNGFVRMVHIIFGFDCTMHTISVDAISLLFIHLKCIALVFVAIVVYVMLSFICKLNIWILASCENDNLLANQANMDTLTHVSRQGIKKRSVSSDLQFPTVLRRLLCVGSFLCMFVWSEYIHHNQIQ